MINLDVFSVEELRDKKIREMIMDYLICKKDKIAIGSWVEDVREAPEDYPYTEYELKGFLERTKK